MRRKQVGRFNLLTILILAALAVAIYASMKFIPVYIEKSRISRLVQQAANQWANTTPQLEDVQKELQYNFEVAQVESVTEQDVHFARDVNNEVDAWVEYEVVIEHPYNIIKPTVLDFYIERTATPSAFGVAN